MAEKLKISTEISSIAKLVGEEKALEYVARAGFDSYDFSMFSMCIYKNKLGGVVHTGHPLSTDEYLPFVRNLVRRAKELGLSCNQSHAPFPTSVPEVRSVLKRAIECTALAGGKICVIHPDNNKNAEQNAEFFHSLLPFAKECGVKIATENMWNWDKELDQAAPAACSDPKSFVEHVDVMNDESFVACLDIGHAEMRGLGTSAVEMIRALGPRLQALHLHDNDFHKDSHQIPGSMSIDFEAVMGALKEIGYKGELTLEADCYLRAFEGGDVAKGVCDLADSARRLADLYDRI